jgi:hypothetical protein
VQIGSSRAQADASATEGCHDFQVAAECGGTIFCKRDRQFEPDLTVATVSDNSPYNLNAD